MLNIKIPIKYWYDAEQLVLKFIKDMNWTQVIKEKDLISTYDVKVQSSMSKFYRLEVNFAF